MTSGAASVTDVGTSYSRVLHGFVVSAPLRGLVRTDRVRHKPRRRTQQRRPRFSAPVVMTGERPAEAEDRAVPGHWEGGLVLGKDGRSAIGTLVERTTRYVMLPHLPGDHSSESVRDALAVTAETLPAHLTQSPVWDQGGEMDAHGAFTVATGIPVCFRDPAGPRQRGSDENPDGLLRQYFPKGTDLSVHTRRHPDAVAGGLNGRPRRTLGWDTPAERLHRLLAA